MDQLAELWSEWVLNSPYGHNTYGAASFPLKKGVQKNMRSGKYKKCI